MNSRRSISFPHPARALTLEQKRRRAITWLRKRNRYALDPGSEVPKYDWAAGSPPKSGENSSIPSGTNEGNSVSNMDKTANR